MSFVNILKHLQGKHDQASHGKGGGGAATANSLAKSLGGEVLPARKRSKPTDAKRIITKKPALEVKGWFESNGWSKQKVHQTPDSEEGWYEKGGAKVRVTGSNSFLDKPGRYTIIQLSGA